MHATRNSEEFLDSGDLKSLKRNQINVTSTISNSKKKFVYACNGGHQQKSA